MFALPGALLGLVRLLCHQSVLDPTSVSGSFIQAPQTHERLADASLTRWTRGPVSLRRILPAARESRQTSPYGGGSGSPLSGPKGGCYTTATPRAGCRFEGSPRAREEYDFGPLYPWRRRTGVCSLMDAKQVWRAVLGELQVSLSPANFETWLKDTALVEIDENRFRIAVPNGFARDWLDNRYRPLISQ